jgi:hypothetical protein
VRRQVRSPFLRASFVHIFRIDRPRIVRGPWPPDWVLWSMLVLVIVPATRRLIKRRSPWHAVVQPLLLAACILMHGNSALTGLLRREVVTMWKALDEA